MAEAESAMRSEIQVYFRLRGFPMSPADLTAELGVEPTDTWQVGQPRRLAKGAFKENGWEISSGLEKAADLEAHVHALLEKITPHREKFKKVSASYPPELVCVVYSYGGDRPALFFTREVVRELAMLNVEIGIDLYVMDGD